MRVGESIHQYSAIGEVGLLSPLIKSIIQFFYKIATFGRKFLGRSQIRFSRRSLPSLTIFACVRTIGSQSNIWSGCLLPRMGRLKGEAGAICSPRSAGEVRHCPATVSSSEQVRPPAPISSPHSRGKEVGTASLDRHSPLPCPIGRGF